MPHAFRSHLASSRGAKLAATAGIEHPQVVPAGNAVAVFAIVIGAAAFAVSWIPVVSLFMGAPLGLAAVACGLFGVNRAVRVQRGFVAAVIGLALGGVALLLDFMGFLLTLR